MMMGGAKVVAGGQLWFDGSVAAAEGWRKG